MADLKLFRKLIHPLFTTQTPPLIGDDRKITIRSHLFFLGFARVAVNIADNLFFQLSEFCVPGTFSVP